MEQYQGVAADVDDLKRRIGAMEVRHRREDQMAEAARRRARAAALPPDPGREAVLVQARWMVEELRVSLFAQTLGTPHKVSLKRIQKVLAQV